MDNNLIKTEEMELVSQVQGPLGFEDEDSDDLIIPRVKMVQSLSPERKEKVADEGDIINSLTKEKLNGKKFIPVYKFNSNILWNDRSDGGGIACRAGDGKIGVQTDGTKLACRACLRCEFDNTKTGKEAIPDCVKYINFFGFFEGEAMPTVLSFSKTNYKEGKKLYSLAKVQMQNMWHFGYTLESKVVSKNGNEWYIIDVKPAGATAAEDRALGMSLYSNFRNMDLNFDMNEETTDTTSAPVVDADTKTEF